MLCKSKRSEEKIDMVDIFRAKEFIYDITNEAIEISKYY